MKKYTNATKERQKNNFFSKSFEVNSNKSRESQRNSPKTRDQKTIMIKKLRGRAFIDCYPRQISQQSRKNPSQENFLPLLVLIEKSVCFSNLCKCDN
mgnify:CR=1 FL=1